MQTNKVKYFKFLGRLIKLKEEKINHLNNLPPITAIKVKINILLFILHLSSFKQFKAPSLNPPNKE